MTEGNITLRLKGDFDKKTEQFSNFIKSLEYQGKTYEWHKESKTFRNNENDIFLDLSSQKNITGKIAVWHLAHKSECILLYQHIDITNYTPSKESFAKLYKKITDLNEEINSGWIPELKADKSKDSDCLEKYTSFFTFESNFFDLSDFRIPNI